MPLGSGALAGNPFDIDRSLLMNEVTTARWFCFHRSLFLTVCYYFGDILQHRISCTSFRAYACSSLSPKWAETHWMEHLIAISSPNSCFGYERSYVAVIALQRFLSKCAYSSISHLLWFRRAWWWHICLACRKSLSSSARRRRALCCVLMRTGLNESAIPPEQERK